MGKREIARYEQFLLFPQCFQKACFPGASKGVFVWEWVKRILAEPGIELLSPQRYRASCGSLPNIVENSIKSSNIITSSLVSYHLFIRIVYLPHNGTFHKPFERSLYKNITGKGENASFPRFSSILPLNNLGRKLFEKIAVKRENVGN